MNTVISPVNVEKRQKLGIKAGDTVRVHQKIQEKGKTRLQAFEGLVLCHKHGNEAGATFTVRRTASGVGVEKIFPLYSPMIDKIEIVKRSKVRQAKLYYIREKVAKEIRRAMRNARMMDATTGSDIQDKEDAKKAAEEAEAKAAEEAAKAEEEAAKKAEEEAQAAEASADDLTKIEGIGPKIAEVFSANGFPTFESIAGAKADDLKKILDDNSLGQHDPGTWPEQAKMAHAGEWDKLKEWQDKLDGGKEA